ncbi:MAG: cell division protein SepF [Clostridia bacterium]|nr:cell division protein SepF [Clostridia bacterium]
MDLGEFVKTAFGSEEKEPMAPLFADGAPPSAGNNGRRDMPRDNTVRIQAPAGGGRPKKEKKGWFFGRKESAPYVSNSRERPAPVQGAPVAGSGRPAAGNTRQASPQNIRQQPPRRAPGPGYTQNARPAAPANPPRSTNQSSWQRKQNEGADVFTGFGKKRSRPADPLETFDVPAKQPGSAGRIMNMNGDSVGGGSVPIRIYTPRKVEDKATGKKMHYGEYKRIIDDFVAGCIVMLNLKNLDTGADDEKNKVLCLVFGAVAAVDGYIYMIADNMYIIARNDTDVAGAIKEGRVGAYMPGM